MQSQPLNFNSVEAPLAAKLRPAKISDYVGQQHILGPDKPLYKAIKSGNIHSMIFWGPPGSGKTTLAEIIANSIDANVERISAVTSGIKEIRQAIENAKLNGRDFGRQTILFVDEVHRFNKAQQDAFLPHIEDGTVIFIGATTENPSFELNNALLSRARVYVLKKLEDQDLITVIANALQLNDVELESTAQSLLLKMADGDARKLLNVLEIAITAIGQELDNTRSITSEDITQASGQKIASFDKGGDQYYDLLSAFHKSVRGSSPDAALYWFCRWLEGGGEPTAIARRLLAIASEDIGNADPRALDITLNAWDVFHRVGPAEGERAIAQAILYCASAAKSNAVYTAFKKARRVAAETSHLEVPLHIRNAPSESHKTIGAGEGYRYAHNEDNAYAAGENYFPEPIKDSLFYEPQSRGLETKIQDKLKLLRELDQRSELKRYE